MRDHSDLTLRSGMRALSIFWVLACTLLLASGLSAAESKTSSITEQEIAALVEQLGDYRIAFRDAASKRLIEIGQPAKAQLEAAIKEKKGPIPGRAELVLMNIARREERVRLKAFAAGDLSISLPGWESYSRIVGKTHDARLLFLEMYRLEAKLLKACEENSNQTLNLLASRCNTYELVNANKETAGSLAAILWVSGSYQGELPEPLELRILSVTQGQGFAQLLQENASESLFRKLLGAWIANPRDSELRVLHRKAEVATQYRFEEGLVPAFELLKSDNRSYILFGLMAVASLGNRQHISRLEPLLEGEFASWTVRRATRRGLDVQLRDLVLAVLVHLSGQDLKDFGFKHLVNNKQPRLDELRMLYFSKVADREQALTKWLAWSKANLESQPKN